MFFCDKCGTIMTEDSNLTAYEYSKVVTHIVDEEGELIKDNIPKFITFACRKCGNFDNVDIALILAKIQDRSIVSMLKNRINSAYKDPNRDNVDEANGISYCGICPGVIDGSGYCYNDVINYCKVRKEILIRG